MTPRTPGGTPLLDDARAPVRVGVRLLLAAAIAAGALGVVALLEPLLARPYFFPAFAAIVLSAVVAGGRYGVVTTALFALGYAYWDLQPRGVLAVKHTHELVALVAYSVTGCLVAAIGGALRDAFARLRSDHALLERTVAQREDILRALTHDVRSPLGAIRVNAALLARDGGADPGVARRARAIEASVVRIDGMVDDLVKVVALESGQVVLERAAVALGSLLDQVRETLAGALPMERVELRIPPDLPPVWADRARLERALVNLISNGLKYSEGPVTVAAALRDGEVVVSVQDRGAGMAADELPRLFHKYYRGSAAREREGLGLGLYITRLLVEAHGGRLWVESAPGAGSTFSVALPAARAVAAPASSAARPARRPRRGPPSVRRCRTSFDLQPTPTAARARLRRRRPHPRAAGRLRSGYNLGRAGARVTEGPVDEGMGRGGRGTAGNGRAGLRALLAQEPPLELRLLGRTLLHAGAVGVVAGLIGAAFFASLELGQRLLLGGIAGFEPLRARGETFLGAGSERILRPLVLVLVPALGGLASGLLTTFLAPEAAGGGGDAAIEAYHRGGVVRPRVIPVKGLAAVLTLSAGGAGGREGPTMQIGAAIGALVGRLLPTRRSERRVLLVAGIAAGIAAVFRTPLGAALLATEMLYRDDFEAEALVPAILASVVSYSIVIALFGESTLFGALPRFPFHPGHLLLYAALALVVSLAAVAFVRTLRAVQRVSVSLPVPRWARPAVGGLAMGLVGAGVVLWMERSHGPAAAGFGVFGGGYGTLQAAMTGAGWMPAGASAAVLLAGVAVAKIAAASLTIGTGAAAGDFAPSLTIGGLVGAAFGVAARTALADPSIEPAAFALVGMGTFYGGLAHAPLSALVLVAELAGSYDLLVPMMLGIGIATVALRRSSLYPAQVANRAASPAHRDAAPAPVLARVADRSTRDLRIAPTVGPIPEHAPLPELLAAAARAGDQRVVALAGAAGYSGLVELATVEATPETERHWMRAHDARVPFVSVHEDASWSHVAEVLERCGLSQVPVVRDGAIVGWVGDRELRRAVLESQAAPA